MVSLVFDLVGFTWGCSRIVAAADWSCAGLMLVLMLCSHKCPDSSRTLFVIEGQGLRLKAEGLLRRLEAFEKVGDLVEVVRRIGVLTFIVSVELLFEELLLLAYVAVRVVERISVAELGVRLPWLAATQILYLAKCDDNRACDGVCVVSRWWHVAMVDIVGEEGKKWVISDEVK
ncbi:hypothetical protein Droror1_Dr00015061 [Drosera rotundifolia]